MDAIRTLFAATRPSFLVLAPVSVLLGVATAVHSGAAIDSVQMAAVLTAALAAHVAVNTLNEYQDFHSGLDLYTHRTPFSGGSGALPAYPAAATRVRNAALVALSVTVLLGLYLVWLRGPVLLAIGITGVAIILGYTRWLNRQPWLCLLAPGLAFGPLMVAGSHLALTGGLDGAALAASLLPFFLANNLLLLNQYPDIDADRRAGRRTFPIAYGTGKSNIVYGLFLLLAIATVIVPVADGMLPALGLLALLPLLLGVAALRGALLHHHSLDGLLPALGMNVATAVFTPLLLGSALLLD